MKRLLSSLFTVVVLSGCTADTTSPTLQQNMQNPLFAERYHAELIDRMASLQINNDPILKEKRIADAVDAAKLKAMKDVESVRAALKQGVTGRFVTAQEFTVGSVFVKDGIIYFSTDFATFPGEQVHVYITNAVDPRDVKFPDDTSIDLGLLASPYGHHQYVIPEDKRDTKFRTVVLYDKAFARVFAFAQL